MILVDVNVFVDVLSGRKGFEDSIRVIDYVRKGKIDGYISALTVPLLWFLLSKWRDSTTAKKEVREIIKGFRIVALSDKIIEGSFNSEIEDFEDAIQFFSAIEAGCTIIVTRNKKDFKKTENINILTPEEFLSKGGVI
jgi:predicted nucleic acid-binding protein